eukprot:9378445-Lingulodinium_polyedra.AAC.1
MRQSCRQGRTGYAGRRSSNRLRSEVEAYGSGSRVADVDSPFGLTFWAKRLGMAPEMAFDLAQKDPDDGRPW